MSMSQDRPNLSWCEIQSIYNILSPCDSKILFENNNRKTQWAISQSLVHQLLPKLWSVGKIKHSGDLKVKKCLLALFIGIGI
jgi:hypothetical protein